MASGRPGDGNASPSGDRHSASDFSVANLLLNRETDLSLVFAHLLDPGADHAQGDTFLAALLAELDERSTDDWSPAGAAITVTTEHSAPVEMPDGEMRSGRIDILVEREGCWRIAIENKPWAWDQEEQVERYLRYLQDSACESGSGNEVFLLLYWSGNGSAPTWTKKPEGWMEQRCVTMPYRETDGRPSVEGWLRRCRDACQAPCVLWFLNDLIRYVRRWFPDDTHLLKEEAERLGMKPRRGGWLLEQDGRTGGWPGVWIWRQNQSAPSFEVGASGWGDDNVRKRLRAAGENLVDGPLLTTSIWCRHAHNCDPDKRHVSWLLDGDRVFPTDDREKGVKGIMALAKPLIRAAGTG